MTGAILLSGGRASRVGGAAKHLFEVDGVTLLDRAIHAVAGCSPVIVVGDAVAGHSTVIWTREDPPFGGPAAAVVCALDTWTAERGDDPEWTYLLGCDAPGAVDAVRRLESQLDSAPHTTEGLCLADSGGNAQWLIGAYRTSALRRARAGIADDGRDASMRALLGRLSLVTISAPENETADVDTWEDLERARNTDERQRR